MPKIIRASSPLTIFWAWMPQKKSPIEPTPSVSLPTKNTIITLPPQAIRAFRGHPFRLYEATGSMIW